MRDGQLDIKAQQPRAFGSSSEETAKTLAEPGTAQPCEMPGNPVWRRLVGLEAMRPLPLANLTVFLMRDFMSSFECARMIELIESDSSPSGLMAPCEDADFRTSDTSFLRGGDAFVLAIERRIDVLLGIAPKYGETIQGQRYSVGQQFKAHHDFFHEDQEYWPLQRRMGGQRTWTAMIFLNAPEAGGKTFFPLAGVKVGASDWQYPGLVQSRRGREAEPVLASSGNAGGGGRQICAD